MYHASNKPGVPHNALYWRFGRQLALRIGDWKIVKAPDVDVGPGELPGKATTAGAQLYNLKDDIGETQNLAGKSPQKLNELAEVWEKWNAELIVPKWGPPPAAAGKKAGKLRNWTVKRSQLRDGRQAANFSFA